MTTRFYELPASNSEMEYIIITGPQKKNLRDTDLNFEDSQIISDISATAPSCNLIPLSDKYQISRV
jgi:hypothetical protein